ncbi:MAG: hypothetical protein ACI4IK_02760 [Eubacterium sp.]
MKRYLAFLLSLLTVFSFPTLIALADDTHKEKYTVSLSELNDFSPEKEIEVNGDTYKFTNYKIVNNRKETFEITVDNLTKKEYKAPENAVNPNNPNQKGKLISTTFSENKESNRNTIVTKEASFDKAQLDYTIPETYKTEYRDEKTGSVINIELTLKDTKKSSPYWITANDLEGVVTGYDALYYTLNNSSTQIPKNEKQPVFKGYEGEILKSLKLSNSEYKITGSSWAGDAYYNSDGILCRNCIYNAQMKVCDITATYSAKVDLPDYVTYNAISVYEDEGGSQYTIEAEYEKENKVNTAVIIIGAVIGLLVMALLIAAVLIYLSKKKGGDKSNNGFVKK